MEINKSKLVWQKYLMYLMNMSYRKSLFVITLFNFIKNAVQFKNPYAHSKTR